MNCWWSSNKERFALLDLRSEQVLNCGAGLSLFIVLKEKRGEIFLLSFLVPLRR